MLGLPGEPVSIEHTRDHSWHSPDDGGSSTSERLAAVCACQHSDGIKIDAGWVQLRGSSARRWRKFPGQCHTRPDAKQGRVRDVCPFLFVLYVSDEYPQFDHP